MRIEEASNLLHIPAQSLRLWLRSGHCPFGDAWQGRGKGYQYFIAPDRLNAYLSGQDIKKECIPSKVAHSSETERISSKL